MKTKRNRDLLLLALLCGTFAACNLNTSNLSTNDPNFNCQDSKNVSIAIAPETSPEITAALHTLVSSSQTERNSSIDALVKIGTRVIIPLFSLRKNSCYWGNSILDAMYEVTRRIGSPAIPLLITILKTPPDPSGQQMQVVFAVVRSLGKMGESVIPALMPLLSDPNVQVRHNATTALGSVGKPAIPQLISISKQNSDQGVRTLALQFLKELGVKPIQ